MSDSISLLSYLSMARPQDPEARDRLLRKAAAMVRARQPVTLRGVVEGSGVSTQAVYTYFGGMDGLFSAVRQEGFRLLAQRLAGLDPTGDTVADLAVITIEYVRNALDNPDLYRVMFDATVPLADDGAAAATLAVAVEAVQRATADGRFDPHTDVRALATRLWVVSHGACNLACSDIIAASEVTELVLPAHEALFVMSGDDPIRAATSVHRARQST